MLAPRGSALLKELANYDQATSTLHKVIGSLYIIASCIFISYMIAIKILKHKHTKRVWLSMCLLTISTMVCGIIFVAFPSFNEDNCGTKLKIASSS